MRRFHTRLTLLVALSATCACSDAGLIPSPSPLSAARLHGTGEPSLGSTPPDTSQTQAQPKPGPLPSETEPTYTLSGIVFVEEAFGPVPLYRARVVETSSGRTTMTGRDGVYSISGLAAGSRSVSAGLTDVMSYTKTLVISGDTRLDIELQRYTLSGVVFERTPAGTAPIAGVEIYCDGCGSPDGHTFVYTDAQGFYSLSYTYSGTNPIIVTKAGYNGAGWRYPVVDGDTTFDIELVKR